MVHFEGGDQPDDEHQWGYFDEHGVPSDAAADLTNLPQEVGLSAREQLADLDGEAVLAAEAYGLPPDEGQRTADKVFEHGPEALNVYDPEAAARTLAELQGLDATDGIELSDTNRQALRELFDKSVERMRGAPADTPEQP